MLKKITSTLLVISFIVLAFSGIVMGISKPVSDYLALGPFHALSAAILIISGIIHIVLNFKTFKSYFRNRYVKIVFSSAICILATMYIIAMNMKSSDDGLVITEFDRNTEVKNQMP